MEANIPKDTYSIRRFFSGKTLLITGSTGLVGKALTEKILRDIPDVKKLYLAIRPRAKPNGQLVDSRERLQQDILSNCAFDRLRRIKGDAFEEWFHQKVACVPVDLMYDGMGIDPDVYRRLVREVDVVIHPAATVNFTEMLDLALELNTLGPPRLLELARAAGATLVQISTAYVCGNRTGRVPERIMAPMEAIDKQLPEGAPRPKDFSVEEEIRRLREQCERIKADCEVQCKKRGWASDSEEARGMQKRALVSAGMRRARSLGWNDTYTYTKFMGEQLIKMRHGDVPTIIVRPSIIESSMTDPEPGWLQNLRVADPLIVNFGKGRLIDFPAKREIAIDLIPADLVVNAILAGAAFLDGRKGAFEVIHAASSSENPLPFEKMYQIVRDYFQRDPMLDRAGNPVAVPTWKFPTVESFKRRVNNRYLRPMKVARALVAGPVEIPGTKQLRARIKTLSTIFEQLLDQVDQYSFYTNLDCIFETKRALEILDLMDAAERETFDYDPRKIHWRQYLQDVHIPGIKRNILRLDSAHRKKTEQRMKKVVSPATPHTEIHGVSRTIVDLIARGAHHFGNRPFLVMRRGPRQVNISFEQLHERSRHWGQRLMARLGVSPGDRIALWSENCPEWSLAYAAIAQAGCTAVPIDVEMDPEEVQALTHSVQAKAGLLSPSVFDHIRNRVRQGQNLPPMLNIQEELRPFPGFQYPISGVSEDDIKLEAPLPDSIASILFTSGTTLFPKGAMLTHSNLTSNALSVAEVLEPLTSDRFLSVLPLHHAFEFTGGFLVPLLGGAQVHHMERLRLAEVVETMKSEAITVVLAVPRLFQLFADGIKARLENAGITEKVALSIMTSVANAAEMVQGAQARKNIFKKVHESFGGKMRLFVSGGASLDPELFHFFKRLGIKIAEGYGLTETGPILSVNPIEDPRPSSVGRPIPGVQIRIHNPDARGVGEIQARSPGIMKGYWGDPEGTETAFSEGWFRTGDEGRFARDNYLYIAGRRDDVIVTSAGKKVYPERLESYFRELEHVKEYGIVGLPVRHGHGEEVGLVAVPEDAHHEPQICKQIEEINRSLPSHQRVARIEMFARPLPRTSTDKLQRRSIQAHLASSPSASSVRLARVGGEDLTDDSDRVLLEQIRHAITDIVDIPRLQITPREHLHLDLGLDSISRVDLIGRLEIQMNLSIPDEVLPNAITVQDLMTALKEARADEQRTRRMPLSGFGKRIWSRRPSDGTGMAQLEPSLSKSIIQGAFKTTAKVLFNAYLSIEVTGLENLPEDGAYILASNHTSHLDIAAIREALGKHANALHVMAARDYFFDARLKSWFLTNAFNLLPMDRDRISPDDIRRCSKILEKKKSLLTFPEATRSMTGEIQRFKSAIGILALELDYPILPVHVRGTYKALPKGRTIVRPSKVVVRFGKPLEFEDLKQRRKELDLEGRRENKRPPGLTGLYRKAATLIQMEVENLGKILG